VAKTLSKRNEIQERKQKKKIKETKLFLGYMVKLRLTCTGEMKFHLVSFFSKEG